MGLRQRSVLAVASTRRVRNKNNLRLCEPSHKPRAPRLSTGTIERLLAAARRHASACELACERLLARASEAIAAHAMGTVAASDVPWFNNFGEAAPDEDVLLAAGASAHFASMSTLSAVDKISACSLVSPSMARCHSSGVLGHASGGSFADAEMLRTRAKSMRSMRGAHSGVVDPEAPPPAPPLPPPAQTQPPQPPQQAHRPRTAPPPPQQHRRQDARERQ